MADRYVAVHANPRGPGDNRPDADQIIRDEGLIDKLFNRTAFITGCSPGIGIDTSKALFLTGASLYLTARDISKAKAALGDTLVSSPRVHFLELDLASFASVHKCAEAFLSLKVPLNILICNAGVMTPPEGRTQDGFETQFGTNHLAHFLLFELLRPALLAGVTQEFASRVVILASIAHRFGEVRFDSVNFDGHYDAMAAYAQSKTANLWTANEIERRYGAQGIHAWSVQPGAVLTDLTRRMSDEQQNGLKQDDYLSKIYKTPSQGASTSVWAATAAALEGKGGRYLEDCQIIGAWEQSKGLYSPGYGEHAYSVSKASLLWEKSNEWVR